MKTTTPIKPFAKGRLIEAEIKDIDASSWNPRRKITKENVAELTQSVKEVGLLNPLSLIKGKKDGRYVVFAGHRRLAACKFAGFKTVPALVFDLSEEDALILTVLENLQRRDIEPIQEALEIEKCLNKGFTGEEIAARIGKSNTWVTRRRKLLSIPEAIRKAAEAHPGAITTDCLENIALRPDAAKALASEIALKIEQADDRISWVNVSSRFDEYERELDTATFVKFPKCGSTEQCGNCPNRTGAQGDLFKVVKGYGKCLDTKCFEKHMKDWRKAVIAEKIAAGTEVVVLKHSWDFPGKTSPTPTRKFPCAYIYFGIEKTDGFDIRYGESAKEKKEADAERKAKEKLSKQERNEEIERINAIKNKITDLDDGNKEAKAFFAKHIADKALAEYVSRTIIRFLQDTWQDDELLNAINALPFIKSLLTEDEIKAFTKYVKED